MAQDLLLLGAGLAAGFVGGLIGVGGGIIFAPVLFFYFQGIGVPPEALAPLTIGSSLFCTFIVALASAWFQHRKGAVRPRVAVGVGLSSAGAVYLMTRYVTTQPWYDGDAFQLVFSVVLIGIVVRMLTGRAPARAAAGAEPALHGPALVGIGTAAGAVASAVGVGGGVVLVPAYAGLLRMPFQAAVGTSSATIVLISLVGVTTYALMGEAVTPSALGYVDVGRALLLAVPAVFSARLGVSTAHRINTRALRMSFAVLALIVAVRLLLRAL